MDKDVQLKLEDVLNYFNRSINMTLENSRNTSDFRARLQSLKKQYLRALENTLTGLGFSRSSIINYASSQFEVVINKFEKRANSHGTNMVGTMIKMSRKELEKAVEILETSTLSQEEKLSEISRISSSKISTLSEEEQSQNKLDSKEVASLESELSLLSSDISSHVARIASSGLNNRDYVQMAAIEAKAQQLKQYLNSRLNHDFLDKYSETMSIHTQGILSELNEKNKVWLEQLNKFALEVSPQQKDENVDTFKLPDEYRKKVEAAGKSQTTPAPNPNRLPDDLIV